MLNLILNELYLFVNMIIENFGNYNLCGRPIVAPTDGQFINYQYTQKKSAEINFNTL